MLVCLVAILVCMTFSEAGAAGPQLLGVGGKSCGTWTAARAKPDNVDNDVKWNMIQWILGYVTAANSYLAPRSDLTNGIDNQGLLAWIDKHCREEPLHDIAFASRALVVELMKQVPR